MIEDKEDCCENCEEGIEPCCDEELAEHIDAIFAEVEVEEQSEPEQPDPFVPEVKAKSSKHKDLAKHICCPNQFHHIYDAMTTMNNKELVKLREELRKHTKNNTLHPTLEIRLRNAIAKSK
jgi:hypothetical protein